MALHALRLGLKFRPIHVLSPEGFGYAGAVALTYQLSSKPVFGVIMEQDSLRTGGYLSGGEEDRLEFGSAPTALGFAALGSYRAPRFSIDGGLVYQNVRSDGAEPTAITLADGLSPRLGGLLRITPGFGIGASWWGKGAPPWQDRILLRIPETKQSQFAPFITFGANPEAGIDLMVVSPTGSFGESAQLLIRGRSTR